MILSSRYWRLELTRKELMSWVTWVAILVGWPLLGLAFAYLFGRFTHRGEVYGDAAQLAPPVVSYLRRVKRTRAGSRVPAQAKQKRGATGGRRLH
jgi:hypothetical protein